MQYQDTTALAKIEAMPNRIKIIQGGARAGKTVAILIILCDLSFEVEQKTIHIVSDTMPNLRHGAMNDWEKMLKGTNREQYFKVNRSINKWENIITGTTIEFLSCDADDALGAARDYLFINEASRISWQTYRQLALRTEQDVWIDFNPVNEFWVHTQLLKRANTSFIKLNYEDNEAIPQNVLEELLANRGDGKNNWWKVYGLGEIGSLEGNVYEGWVAKELEDFEEAKLIRYGLDFGFSNDETGMVAIYQLEDESLFINELIFESGLLGSQYGDKLRSLNIDPNVLIVADSARPEIIAEIRKEGFTIIGANKDAGSILRGIDRVKQHRIYYRGKNLEKEFYTYAWRTKKTGEVLDVPQDGNDHLLDALRYAIDDMSKPRFDF